MFSNKYTQPLHNGYVLVLPSWYPSEVSPFNGDFNQRFVEALSLKVPQIVLYVVGKPNIQKTYFTLTVDGNLKTYLVYYPLKKNIFGKIYAKINYFITQARFLKLIFTQNGLPKLSQVYVFWMAGIAAFALKKIYGIPYIITEHWTGFYKNSPSDMYKNNFLVQHIFKIILKNANHFIAVADKLKNRIQVWNPRAMVTIIPNVVDTSIFYFQKKTDKKHSFRLVHASTMKIQKNIIGLLDGFENAVKENNNLELVLVGHVPQNVEDKINASVLLQQKVTCLGEVLYTAVKDIMLTGDAYIMFSRYENLPCVILEALCCGLPVITTDAGGCAEVINPSNGIVVQNENETELTQAILKMANNRAYYDSKSIAQAASKLYNYETVSAQIVHVYENIT